MFTAGNILAVIAIITLLATAATVVGGSFRVTRSASITSRYKDIAEPLLTFPQLCRHGIQSFVDGPQLAAHIAHLRQDFGAAGLNYPVKLGVLTGQLFQGALAGDQFLQYGNPALQVRDQGVLGVTIARLAYAGEGCSGTLPSPSPSLLHWAAYYHLTVPR